MLRCKEKHPKAPMNWFHAKAARRYMEKRRSLEALLHLGYSKDS